MRLKEVKYINHRSSFENFKKDFEDYKDFFANQIEPFNKKVEDICDRCDVKDSRKFKERTQLDTYQYHRLKQSDNTPSLATLVSFVYGLQQDISILHILCDSLGVKLNHTDPTACAYAFIIERYRGYDIVEANKMLLILGVSEADLLGSPKARKAAVEELQVDMPQEYAKIKN